MLLGNNCHLLVRLQAIQILLLVVFMYLILDENSDIIVKAGYLLGFNEVFCLYSQCR